MICNPCRESDGIGHHDMVDVEHVPTVPVVPIDSNLSLESLANLDNDFCVFKLDMQQKLKAVFEKLAALDSRQAKLEKREDELEEREENFEHLEKSLEVRVSEIQHREEHLEEKVEELEQDGGTMVVTKQQSQVSSYEEFAEKHQARQSVMARKEKGITVDFLEVEATEVYEFNESTWDIAIFIGTPSLGLGGSILTAILLFMNVIMQLIFVGIVWYNFAEAAVNQEMIDSALDWRLGMAHDKTLLTSDTAPSLVSRVCGGDMSLQTATAQQSLFSDVAAYLKPDATGFESIFTGRMLCIVALVCWYLMVSREVHTALDLCRAVVNLPGGKNKLEPVELPMQATRYRVANMPWSRKFYSVGIVVYRMVVAVILGFCGTYFLAFTIEITELVLNAVALEIILNIDDLLFDAVTTANARHMVQRLEPIKMPRWPHTRGMDFKAAVMAFVIPVCVLAADITLLAPMVKDLRGIADALCGGNQDFVYIKNKLNMYEMAPTTAFGDKVEATPDAVDLCARRLNATTNATTNATMNATTNATTCKIKATTAVVPTIKRQAIEEATKQETDSQRAASAYVIWAKSAKVLSIAEGFDFPKAIAGATNGKCEDQMKGPLMKYVQSVFGDPNIRTCADISQWCSSASYFPEWAPDDGKGIMARMVCPQTCECDVPTSAIFMNSGCPTFCTLDAHGRFYHNRNISRCYQPHSTNISKWPLWKTWSDQVREYGNFKKNPNFVTMADQMLTLGCRAMTDGAAVSQCIWNDEAPFKTAGVYCGRQCNCQRFSRGGYRLPDCPVECSLCAFGRRRRGYNKKSKTGPPDGKTLRNCQYSADLSYPRCEGDTHLNCPHAITLGWLCEREGKRCADVGGTLGLSKYSR